MRTTKTAQTGAAGTSSVIRAFEMINWGVVENTRHDLGTDLFVMARDERLFDLGLLVGVQVKTVASPFNRPKKDDQGSPTGWWFTDRNREHADAWITHALPHLLVLHRLSTGESFWVEVTAESVESTGKGVKIFIPKANTIDLEHLADLLTVAGRVKAGTSWEGSAWTGAQNLLPKDTLRHALLAPRLIAPHPNTGHHMPVTPAQALALLVQGRVADMRFFADQHTEQVPTLDAALTSPSWLWRFVGAFGHRVTTGELDVLLSAYKDAPDASARAAAAAVAAGALMEEARAEEAIALLSEVLEPDDAAPVDHAWLTCQLSRAHAEIGSLDAARQEALMVLTIRASQRDDVTAVAISGVASQLLFNTAGWGNGDVAQVVEGADTAAMWWRRQTMAWGLTAATEQAFKRWARDRSVNIGGADTANDQLLAAAMMATNIGDHGDWRHLTSLLIQEGLLRGDRHTDPGVIAAALTALRWAGDADALKLAVRRCVADGPAQAAAEAAAKVDLNRSTRTTAPADLALLECAGEVLDETTADRTVSSLLATLAEPAAFVARTNPSYLLRSRLVQTLAAVTGASSGEAQDNLREHLIRLEPQTDQLSAQAWGQVARALTSPWSPDRAKSIGARAAHHERTLKYAMLAIAVEHDPALRDDLFAEAAKGSMDALGALGDVRLLNADVVSGLIGALGEHVKGQISQAAQNSSSFGTHDYARALVLLNAWHPTLSDWDPIISLLGDARVAGSHQEGAFRALASLNERLPEAISSTLLATATAAAARQPLHQDPFGSWGDARGAAAQLVAALDTSHSATIIADLLAAKPEARRDAARIAGRLQGPEHVGLLVALSSDPDPQLRVAAAGALAVAAKQGVGGDLALQCLRTCLADSGCWVPYAIADALTSTPGTADSTVEMLAALRSNISARVRALAATG